MGRPRTGYLEISGSYWSSLRTNAQRRNIPFEIPIEYAWTLYMEQDQKCALTGWPIFFKTKNHDQTASLDRIDSENGYAVGACQWVSKSINRMKGDFPQEYFRYLCKGVANHEPWRPAW